MVKLEYYPRLTSSQVTACLPAAPASQAIEQIWRAVATVPGVTGQDMEIVGFVQAEELTKLLREMLGDKGNGWRKKI